MKKILIITSLLIVAIAFTQCKKDEENNIYPELNGPVGTTGNTFSVSASKKVYFSQGNLQYNPSSSTWRFAVNQCDTIGVTPDSIPPTYDGWIDLFIYASSGYDSIFPYLNKLPSNKTDIGKTNISGTSYDWGHYNPISNGGNKAGLWRILTKEEMSYLLERQDANGYYLAGKGSLYREDGSILEGVFIMPDNYVGEHEDHFNWGEITETELNKWGGIFLLSAPSYYCLHIGSDRTSIYGSSEYFNTRFGVVSWQPGWSPKAIVRLVQDCTE
ncbi:MAG: hypothetical protein IK025_02320 [Bacteroidales bacterium]|nr:hypothetical protein [Bacteroidales bacterium]